MSQDCARRTRALVDTAAARSRRTGKSKAHRIGISVETAVRSRTIIWAANNECPPRSKKSDSGPTSLRPSNEDQMLPTTSSTGVSNDTDPPQPLGAGNAARSILPFGVKGHELRNTNAAGTM